MKELSKLSIEEKAKRYDEILARAEGANLSYYKEDIMSKVKEFVDYLLPELKEGENEQHRKWILEYLYDGLRKSDEQFKGQFKSAIAWFEKQGEQKSNNEFTFKALPRLLDMIPPTDKAKAYCQKLIDSLKNEGYSVDAKIVGENLKMMNGEEVAMATMDDQKPAKTVIEAWKDMRLEVYQQASGNRHEPNYSDDTTKMFSLNDIDEIFEKIADNNVKQNPAEWSEEDEKHLQKAIECTFDRGYLSTSNWLKFLRPQTCKEQNETIDKIKTQIALCNGFSRENRDKVFELIDSLRPQK